MALGFKVKHSGGIDKISHVKKNRGVGIKEKRVSETSKTSQVNRL